MKLASELQGENQQKMKIVMSVNNVNLTNEGWANLSNREDGDSLRHEVRS